MRVKAITIVLRKDGFFHTGDAIIYRNFNHFKGFKPLRVKAYRRRDGVPGYGVGVILEPSQVDLDFKVPIWFPSVDELRTIESAMDESDRLTESLLGRGWTGVRPYLMLHHFM